MLRGEPSSLTEGVGREKRLSSFRQPRAYWVLFSFAFDAPLLSGRPAKLLLVSTGNIRNRDSEALVVPLIRDLIGQFGAHAFLELDRAGIVIRG